MILVVFREDWSFLRRDRNDDLSGKVWLTSVSRCRRLLWSIGDIGFLSVDAVIPLPVLLLASCFFALFCPFGLDCPEELSFLVEFRGRFLGFVSASPMMERKLSFVVVSALLLFTFVALIIGGL
jgi:hypothetical protein